MWLLLSKVPQSSVSMVRSGSCVDSLFPSLNSFLLTTSPAPRGPPDSVSLWTQMIETSGKPGSLVIGALGTTVELGTLQEEILSSANRGYALPNKF